MALDDNQFEELFRRVRAFRKTGNDIDPTLTCLQLIEGQGPVDLQAALQSFSEDHFDYAAACVYTLLLSDRRRKQLGAYFTPPHIVRHLIERLFEHRKPASKPVMHDPAAGGGAFISPIVRRLTREMLSRGKSGIEVIKALTVCVSGTEIDEGLVLVSNALVRRTLHLEFGIEAPQDFRLVKCGDSLREKAPTAHVVLGNPPYGKVGAERQKEWARLFPDILGGQLNLYAMFLRRSIDMATKRGLVGFVVPTSFLQGPEFQSLRTVLLDRADLICLDLIDKRHGLFLDVTQDTCFVIFRMGNGRQRKVHPEVTCSLLKSDGTCTSLGRFTPTRNGDAWILPTGQHAPTGGYVLADYGYRCSVGYLVHNRQKERIVPLGTANSVPLIRATSIRPDGEFDLTRSGSESVTICGKERYVVRRACVSLQRTANRNQNKRLTSAVVPQAIFDLYGGLVAENHVILLTSNSSPSISSTALVRLFGSKPVNTRWGGMCGTASISIKMLAMLDLPDPRFISDLEHLSDRMFDLAVEKAYEKSKNADANDQKKREADHNLGKATSSFLRNLLPLIDATA